MKIFPLLILLPFLPLLVQCGDKAKSQKKEEAPKPMETELAEKKLESGSPVFIRAFKEERELELFIEDKATGKFVLFRTYPIAAASGTLGPKLAEGDRQVPEGFYFSGAKDMNPNSSFHLSFNVNYPNAYDRAHGRTGSFIMIHGSKVSIGCLAMTDEKIEEIYALCQAALDAGQPFFRIHIFPFRMTEERMAQAAGSPHLPFWKNLKTGYDLFEETRIPPEVSVNDKTYIFEQPESSTDH
ncbi:murein L,D-transpeptidase [Akkermansiaceae bacterium]|nr:murein L,D-transpeptidase [Akkermansiaceae bacterium]